MRPRGRSEAIMGAILGIDAAWTPNGSSGVALIRQVDAERWESAAAEAGYSAFITRSDCGSFEKLNDQPPIRQLVQAAEHLAKTQVTLVVADMPLARHSIANRRVADQRVSEAFGARGCSTHSPTKDRPGLLSEHIRAGFEKSSYQLVTNAKHLPNKALIETYPHPALLSLMSENYRLSYKVKNTAKYWSNSDRPARMEYLLDVLRSILDRLSREISGIDFEVPRIAETFSELKPIEDKIDALICAWVGIQALDGKAEPYGDEEAAIWLPTKDAGGCAS